MRIEKCKIWGYIIWIENAKIWGNGFFKAVRIEKRKIWGNVFFKEDPYTKIK